MPQTIVSQEREPDLRIVTKKYLPVSSPDSLDRYLEGNFHGASPYTNDYEKWKGLEDLYFSEPLTSEPVTTVPESEGLMGEPGDFFDTGLKEGMEKYLKTDPTTYKPGQEPATTVMEEGFLGLGDILSFAGVRSEFEPIGEGLGETQEEAQRRGYEQIAKAGLKWKAYKMPSFPKFTYTNRAINKLSSPPTFFKRVSRGLKAGPRLDKYVSWSGYNKQLQRLSLKFPKMKMPGDIKKLILSTANVNKWTKELKDQIEKDTAIKGFIKDVPAKLEDYVKYLNKNKLNEDYAIWTNAKRLWRQVKMTRRTMEYIANKAVYALKWTRRVSYRLKNALKYAVDLILNLPEKLNSVFKDATNKMQSIVSELKKNVKNYSGDVKKYITGAVKIVKNYLKAVADRLQKWITGILTDLQRDMKEMLSWFTDVMKGIGKGVERDLINVKSWMMDSLTGIQKNIQNNIEQIPEYIEAKLKLQLYAIKDKLEEYKTELVKQFNQTIGKAKTELTTYVRKTQADFKAWAEKTNAEMQERIDSMKAVIASSVKKVELTVKEVEQLTGQVNKLTDMFDKLTGRFSTTEKEIEATEQQVDKQQQTLTQQSDALKELNTGIQTADKRLVSQENRINTLKDEYDKKFSLLEAKIAQLKGTQAELKAKEEEGGFFKSVFG